MVAPQMFKLEYQAIYGSSSPSRKGIDLQKKAERADSSILVVHVVDESQDLERKASLAVLKRFCGSSSKKSRSSSQLSNILQCRMSLFEKSLSDFALSNKEIDIEELYKKSMSFLPHSPDGDFYNEVDEKEAAFYENFDLSRFLDFFSALPFYEPESVKFSKILPAQEASFGSSFEMNPLLEQVFKLKSDQLYSHQVEAIKAVLTGNHVVVSTPTSSGKSLIFNYPILDRLLLNYDKNDPCLAMLIFPTKALAQDQLKKLQAYLGNANINHIKVGIFDGDTCNEERSSIRTNSHIIITNPDMIHAAILPHHYAWKNFIQNLKFIVIDELHVYTGQFGLHVGLVFRRLQRILKLYNNSHIQYIACSATIQNPEQQFADLVNISDINIEKVCKSGAPKGEKEFIIWESKKDMISDATQLLSFFSNRNIRTLLFCKYRKVCEYVSREFSKLNPKLETKIHVYRGGYLADKRREIERKMFDGELISVIATNALELGIDIGDIDVTIHVGFPGSISSLWQQAGRSGRRQNRSLSILVLDANNTIDMFYSKYPERIFNSQFVSCNLEVHSFEGIVEKHVQCAAFECPIQVIADEHYFGPNIQDISGKHLVSANERYYPDPKLQPNPALTFSLRAMNEDIAKILCGSEVLEEIEYSRLVSEYYEGAVYFHCGKSYLVYHINFAELEIYVEARNVSYLTYPDYCVMAAPIRTYESSFIGGNGQLQITTTLKQYFKYDTRKKKIIEAVNVQQKPFQRICSGFWINVYRSILSLEGDEDTSIRDSIEVMKFALLKQVYAMVGSQNISCASSGDIIMFYSKQTSDGWTQSLYPDLTTIIHRAYKALLKCDCKSGCNACVTFFYSYSGEKNVLSEFDRRGFRGIPPNLWFKGPIRRGPDMKLMQK